MTVKLLEQKHETEMESRMLFMVELKHGPETCIASGNIDIKDNAELLINLENTALKHGIKVVGGWAFPVGHHLWYIMEASDSHIVADVFMAIGAHSWNTVTINPVLDHDSFSRDVLGRLINAENSTVDQKSGTVATCAK